MHRKEGAMVTNMDYYELFASSENAALKTLLEQNIISMEDVAKAMKRNIKDFIEANHKFKIYLDSQGRWRTYYKDPNDPDAKRKIIVKKDETELYLTLYELYTNREEQIRNQTLSIEAIFDDWIEYKRRRGISESTIIKYRSDWKCHLQGTPIVRKPISMLTKYELEEWAHALVHDNNMTKTDYINVSSLVRQPLDYAVERGIIDVNLMRKVKLEPRMFKPVRKKSSETQVFTKEELAKLKKVAWDDLEKPHHFALRLTPLAFLFMFQTGLRIGEVCAVRFGDIEGDELHLQRTVERDTKNIKDGLKGNNTERWVMLSSEAKHIIAEAKARQIAAGVYDEGYIFSMDENCLSYRSVSESFRKYCEAAGISYRSSHKARKTFISTVLDGGMNINTVREMVGHADERTTMKSYCYDRHTKDERKDILEKALKA